MSDTIDLSALERKAYLSYHQDGILDLFIGFNVLLFGLWMLADMAYLVGAFVATCTPIYALVKKQITIPRIGYVKFNPSRTARLKRTTLFMVLAGVLAVIPGFLLFLTTQRGLLTPLHFLIDYGMMIVGVTGAIILIAVARMTEIRRLHLYAALFVTLFIGGQFISAPFPYYIITFGAVTLLSGLYLLLVFLKTYPLPTGEATDDRQ